METNEKVCAISVDLASGNYTDVGVVVLARTPDRIEIRPIDLALEGLTGKPASAPLARKLVDVAQRVGTTVIGLDGPQGWKSADNGLEHSRSCERLLRTQGKTGLRGSTKPHNYLGFISFCIETFDALAELGMPRLESAAPLRREVAVETFPTSAWRSLGLPALPGKSKTKQPQLASWTDALLQLGPIKIAVPLSHDQLQAAVAGLGVLALAEGRADGFEAVGHPPILAKDHWVEGFIVNPRREGVAPSHASR